MTERYVCAACVEDEHLADVIRSHATDAECSYCHDSLEITPVALLADVIDYMRERISEEWCDPVEELPYESREGGYQGDVLDSWDVFAQIGYEPTNWALHEDIVQSFIDDHWCRRDYFVMREDERLLAGWESFSGVVKHLRRYTFWTMGDAYGEDERHPDHTPIGTLLPEVGRCITAAELIRRISTDTALWRVRVHDSDVSISTGAELGSPPMRCAIQPNRMSPEGVSMFYGAQDFETACLETVEPDRPGDKRVTGGAFRPVVPLSILDLNALPAIPSFWAQNSRELRLILLFLRQFRREISRPIRRGSTHHLDYVPSQAFTEYVRFDLRSTDVPEIHGICYPSSRNRRRCYVIFAENDQCYELDGYANREQLLSLDTASLRVIPTTDVGAMRSESPVLEDGDQCHFR